MPTPRAFKSSAERKFNDVFYNQLHINENNHSWASRCILLSGIPQGADYDNRIGRQIVCKSIELRGFIEPEDYNTYSNYWRVLIIQDLQSNGTQPAEAEVLNSIVDMQSPGIKYSGIMSFMNLDNRARFKVIAAVDGVCGGIDLTSGAAFAQDPQISRVNIYRSVNLPITYNNTTDTYGAIASGAIWIIASSWNAGLSGTDYGCDFTFTARMRYTDQ